MEITTFTIGAGALASAVRYCARWIDPRPAIPAHGGLMFDLDGEDGLTLVGFNEHATARAFLDVPHTTARRFLVAGRLLAALAPTLPEKPVQFSVDGVTAEITAGRGRYTVPLMDVAEFPTLGFEAETIGTASGGDLAEALHRVASAAKVFDGTAVAHSGAHLDLTADRIVISTTDTYRAAKTSCAFEATLDDVEFPLRSLPPAGVLADAVETFAEAGPVSIGLDDTSFSLTTDTRSLVTRVFDVKAFPVEGIARLLAYESPATAVVNPKELAQPIKRAGVLADKAAAGDAVDLRFAGGAITVSVSGTNNGADEVDAEYDGEGATIRVSSASLQAALSAAPGGPVRIGITPGTRRAMFFSSDTDPDWRYLVQPLTKIGG